MLTDRNSAPVRLPHAKPAATVAAIEALLRQRMSGPAIARHLALPRSTVGVILRRLGLGRIQALEARPPVIRYERRHPSELIHVDIKKLVRIHGVGHRITGDRRGQSNNRGIGWECLHVAIDDASRLAYIEVLVDEKKETTCAFTARTIDWFERHGLTVARLMSDNGFVERFSGTVLDEFFRVKMRETFYYGVDGLQEDLDAWLIHYNTERLHPGYRNMGRRPWETVSKFISQEA